MWLAHLERIACSLHRLNAFMHMPHVVRKMACGVKAQHRMVLLFALCLSKHAAGYLCRLHAQYVQLIWRAAIADTSSFYRDCSVCDMCSHAHAACE